MSTRLNGGVTPRGKTTLTTVVALVVLCLFGIFVVYMLRQIAGQETQWNRAVYVFGGVEAIAFAAAGFLFGREVNRQRADDAEERANRNEAKAAAGQALADLIRAKSKKASAVSNDLSELSEIADKRFS